MVVVRAWQFLVVGATSMEDARIAQDKFTAILQVCWQSDRLHCLDA